MTDLMAILIGALGGVVAGLLGVGGGVLFVPALALVLDEPQVRAEATSLLAIVPVAIVGTIRQHRFGNVHPREALVIGLLSPVGVGIGVVVANEVPERALELGFAALMMFVAARLVRRALSADRAPEPPSPRRPAS